MSNDVLKQGAKTMVHETGRQVTDVVALNPRTMEEDLSGPFSGNVGEGWLFPMNLLVRILLWVIELSEGENQGGCMIG